MAWQCGRIGKPNEKPLGLFLSSSQQRNIAGPLLCDVNYQRFGEDNCEQHRPDRHLLE
jgi:hypothetical protein